MRRPSAKPAVVTSTTGSPPRVRSALVATVVPTLTALTWSRGPPAAANRARAADSPGSLALPAGGADSTLRTCSAPSGETPMTSVKVPPRSIQNCQPLRATGWRGAWLRVSIDCIIRACHPTQPPVTQARSHDRPPRGLLPWPGCRSLGPQDLRARRGGARRGLRGPLGGLSRHRGAARARLAAGRLLQGAGRGSGANRLESRRLRVGGGRLAPARPRRVPHGPGAVCPGASGAARRRPRLSGHGGARLARRGGALRAQRAFRQVVQGGAASAGE